MLSWIAPRRHDSSGCAITLFFTVLVCLYAEFRRQHPRGCCHPLPLGKHPTICFEGVVAAVSTISSATAAAVMQVQRFPRPPYLCRCVRVYIRDTVVDWNGNGLEMMRGVDRGGSGRYGTFVSVRSVATVAKKQRRLNKNPPVGKPTGRSPFVRGETSRVGNGWRGEGG